MAEYSLEQAIEQLRELIREKNDLSEVAVEKIQKLTAELQDANGSFIPIDSIDKIQKGFMNFRINQFEYVFLVFACSDSRVSPTFILNFIPGKAFMARNIANLVPPFHFDKLKFSGVGAIIEYAVTALQVKTILVIGHSRCGGIKRLMTMEDDKYDFIDDWVKIATPAKDFVNENFPGENIEKRCALCEKEAVNLSLENLESYPYVKEGMKEKKLMLLGGYYDFVLGRFLVWPKGHSDHPLVIPGPPPPPTPAPWPILQPCPSELA
ncbi:hypothetical protein V2J09_006791 [Rumex salicifolius]